MRTGAWSQAKQTGNTVTFAQYASLEQSRKERQSCKLCRQDPRSSPSDAGLREHGGSCPLRIRLQGLS